MAIITRDNLFAQKASGAKWDVAVAIKRGNPLPLDDSSIFQTYQAAAEYAANSPIAYPTQIVAVLNADGSNEYYGITQQGTLENVGGSEVDNMSVMLNDKKVSLKNFGQKYYKYVNILPEVATINDLDADAEEGAYCKVDDDWYIKEAEAWALADVYPENEDPYILVEGFTYGLEPKVTQVVGEDGQPHFELAWYERLSYSKDEVNTIVEELEKKIEGASSWGDSF